MTTSFTMYQMLRFCLSLSMSAKLGHAVGRDCGHVISRLCLPGFESLRGQKFSSFGILYKHAET